MANSNSSQSHESHPDSHYEHEPFENGSKTNIRVICRFKPEPEVQTGDPALDDTLHAPPSHQTTIDTHKHTIEIYPSLGGRQPLTFEFDHVLPPNTCQSTTFEVTAKSVILDVLAGYNSTLLCYGPCGAGKTRSMFGDEASSADQTHSLGLLPRCAAYCIHCIKDSASVVEASITISCVEICEEQLRDLIAPAMSSKLQLKRSPSGDTYVEHLTQQYITSTNDALAMIEVIRLNRTKIARGSTGLSSSRSHCLACLTVKQTMNDSVTRRAKCYFGDLAASDSTTTTTTTTVEGDASIMALKAVVYALSAQKSVIPIQNSRLTMLLRDALLGNSKTTFVLNCCWQSFREETINTLRFGQRARLIRTSVRVNQEISRHQLKKIIEDQKLQIEQLKLTVARVEQSRVVTAINDGDDDMVSQLQKLQKLEAERELQKTLMSAQNEKYAKLENQFEELQKMYGSLQQEFMRNEKKQISQVQLLNMAMSEVTHKNAELQTISSHTIRALERVDRELATRQTRKSHDRDSFDGEDTNSSGGGNLEQLQPMSDQNETRGSLVMRLPLPLSVTTLSSSPANTKEMMIDNAADHEDTKLEAQSSDNEDQQPHPWSSSLAVRQVIKQTLEQCRRSVEENALLGVAATAIHTQPQARGNTSDIIAQYHQLQRDYKDAQKALLSTKDEYSLLQKKSNQLLQQNEKLRYAIERITADAKHRQHKMEKGVDQSKIQQQLAYLDNMNMNQHSHQQPRQHNTALAIHIPSSLSPTQPKLLSEHSQSQSPSPYGQYPPQSDRDREPSRSRSTTSRSKSSTFNSTSMGLEDLIVGSPSTTTTSSSASSSSALANSASPKTGPLYNFSYQNSNSKKLAVVPQPKKSDEWKEGLRKRFELIDTDHDGFITLDDFLKFTKKLNPNNSEQQIKNIFYQMDNRSTGRVTWVEFERTFRKFSQRIVAVKKLEAAGVMLAHKNSVAFDEKDEFRRCKLHAIRVWYDNVVYGFQCTWTRKSASTPNKTKTIIGTMHVPSTVHAEDKTQDVFVLAPNEYISCVTVWIGSAQHCVYGITFETTQNRWHEFGGGMGTPVLLQPPDKHAIHAFYGSFTDSLNTIGAYAIPRRGYVSRSSTATASTTKTTTSAAGGGGSVMSRSGTHSKSRSKSKSQSSCKHRLRSAATHSMPIDMSPKMPVLQSNESLEIQLQLSPTSNHITSPQTHIAFSNSQSQTMHDELQSTDAKKKNSNILTGWFNFDKK